MAPRTARRSRNRSRNGADRRRIRDHRTGGRIAARTGKGMAHARTSGAKSAARDLMLAAISTSSAALAASGVTAHERPCEREMARAASTHGVPLGMLYAVGLTETGRGDSLRPYALNIEGRAVYEIDRGEALRQVEAA